MLKMDNIFSDILAKERELIISKRDGEQLTRLEIPGDITMEEAVKKIIASLHPKEKKSKGKPSKITYKVLSSVTTSHEGSKIVFKYTDGKSFYIDLQGNRVLHSDGTEFLLVHYDRVDTLIEEILGSTDILWVKRFMAYMVRCSISNLNLSDRTQKLGTFLRAFVGSRFVGPVERLAKSGVLGSKGYNGNYYTLIDVSIDYGAETIQGMLEVDKWFMKQFRGGNFDRYTVTNYNEAMKVEPIGDAFRYASERYGYTIGSDDREVMLHLIHKQGLDWKRLVDYCLSDLPLQGETPREGLTTLRDYISMSVDMEEEYERYPRYLRTKHNAVAARYKLNEDRYLQSRYERLKDNNDLKRFNFMPKNNKYFIRIPKTLSEIAQEGADLNHCVASYTDRMIGGETLIVFMRDREHPSKSLITIEVIGDRMIQAKGRHNGNPDDEQMKFIDKYIKHLNKIKEEESG
jgi:hypothetical protein